MEDYKDNELYYCNNVVGGVTITCTVKAFVELEKAIKALNRTRNYQRNYKRKHNDAQATGNVIPDITIVKR